jgi:hypothetical protein
VRNDGLRPHYFRGSFEITAVPARATLYLAGPRQATIYLNGKEVGHYQLNLSFPMGIRVYPNDVGHWLRRGKNVLAVEAIRGPMAGNEALSAISRHLRAGKVLATMIVPATRGIQAPPLMMSDADWRATAPPPPAGWLQTGFNDSACRKVDDLGGIESAIGLFQANADAGMYAWPGCDGISPFLARYPLKAMEVRRVYAGLGTLKNVQVLTGDTHRGPFTVTLPVEHVARANVPQVILDFWREVINDVFGTHFLMRTTLDRLIGPAPIHTAVNGIPGYSALWVNAVFNYYLHTGSKRELKTVHTRLVEFLDYISTATRYSPT